MVLLALAFLGFQGAEGQEKHDTQRQFTAAVRVPFLGGDAFDDEPWSDVFHTGVGLGIRYAYLFPMSDQIDVGPYLGLSLDTFSGKQSTVINSGLPVTFELESLEMLRLVAGGKAQQRIGSLFLEERLGTGLAIYGPTDGDVFVLGIPFSIEAIDFSTAFTFEAGVDVGLTVDSDITFTLGASYEVSGSPDDGGDLKVDYERMSNGVLSFGLHVRW
jgi:hypothetical protein